MSKYQSLLVHAKRHRKSVSQVYAELTGFPEKPAAKKPEEKKSEVKAESKPAPKPADKDEKSDGDYKGMSNKG
jgi:hypothetical protein